MSRTKTATMPQRSSTRRSQTDAKANASRTRPPPGSATSLARTPLRQSRSSFYGEPVISSKNRNVLQIIQNINTEVSEHLSHLHIVTHNILVLANQAKKRGSGGNSNSNSDEQEWQLLRDAQEQGDRGRVYSLKTKVCLEDLKLLLHSTAKSPALALAKSETDFANNVLQTSTNKFYEEVRQMLAAQSQFEDNVRERMRLKMKQAHPGVSDSQIQTMVEEKRTGDKQILLRLGNRRLEDVEEMDLREEYMDLDEEAKALFELEERTRELSEMFLYIRELVAQQDEQIATIEDMVYGAQTFVGEGVETLQEGETFYNRYMVKTILLKVCVWGCGVLLIVLVVTLLSCYLGPCKSGSGGASTVVVAGGAGAPAAAAPAGSSSFSEKSSSARVVVAPRWSSKFDGGEIEDVGGGGEEEKPCNLRGRRRSFDRRSSASTTSGFAEMIPVEKDAGLNLNSASWWPSDASRRSGASAFTESISRMAEAAVGRGRRRTTPAEFYLEEFRDGDEALRQAGSEDRRRIAAAHFVLA